MNRYSYCGPVKEFDSLIMNKFEAETVASSEKKARSNFAYQFKKKYNRSANAKISLPGKIIIK